MTIIVIRRWRKVWNTIPECYGKSSSILPAPHSKKHNLLERLGELFCAATHNNGQVLFYSRYGDAINHLQNEHLQSSGVDLTITIFFRSVLLYDCIRLELILDLLKYRNSYICILVR